MLGRWDQAALGVEFGGIRMTRENRYRPSESRLETDYVFETDGQVDRAQAAHHVHTTGEVVRLLRDAGFRDVDLRGADGTSPTSSARPA
jgi:hypothetical protein